MTDVDRLLDEAEGLLDDATMHMRNGQYGRAVEEAHGAIWRMDEIENAERELPVSASKDGK